MDTGTSLCKPGFPFHSIIPTFDETTNNFKLPEASFPLPLFPLEGIYTRTIQINIPDSPLSFPLKYIETSSLGLIGQSGGPTFNTYGTVWAILTGLFPEMGLACFFLKREGNNWRLNNTGMQPQQPTGEINQDIIDRLETAIQ